MNIINIEMSATLYNQLILHKINNIEDLSNIEKDKIIYNWKILGRKCLQELIDIMNEYNIKFKEEE